MSQKSKDMVSLFRSCGLKHKTGCFAKSCEECIDRFDNDLIYEKEVSKNKKNTDR